MTTPNNHQTQRFVSLHGFFAVEYPKTWSQETDEHGQYIFSNESGGSGVTRIIVLDNEFKGENAAKEAIQEIYNQNRSFSPSLMAAPNGTFVHYIKDHSINGSTFTVYYWASAYADKIILIAYTVQANMKEMDTSIKERADVESLVGSIAFLHQTAKQG
jgi:hypothetical protein